MFRIKKGVHEELYLKHAGPRYEWCVRSESSTFNTIAEMKLVADSLELHPYCLSADRDPEDYSIEELLEIVESRLADTQRKSMNCDDYGQAITKVREATMWILRAGVR